MIFGLGKVDRKWRLKFHKLSGGLHARQKLEKIVNRTVIAKVC